MSVYDFKVKTAGGQEISLEEYKGKVLIIVNTASKCGFTPQYEELEELYKKYGNEKFEILAFPCNQFGKQEPGNNQEIQSFCQLNYGVSFPVFAKVDVNGSDTTPLYDYLKKEQSGLLTKAIKWNFTKFLVDAKGDVVKRYAPTTSPLKLEEEIKRLIEQAD
ncbi:glutathione peroxidase [Orenia metallireducens]|jgi:glutathione peroxidase|uniref:Glutathione peroxidase n=1 Tax=Orenia metallireducens TaxID=1413210 RepID=A0A285HI88_9FIRM|nr:glutathione peroxidase [Orenia metallireducens]PRX27224.1 glutathione peroxidase [Orenia metallireducens]SNY35470.1 glutathione peroxidase [Orenia metallireducens]